MKKSMKIMIFGWESHHRDGEIYSSRLQMLQSMEIHEPHGLEKICFCWASKSGSVQQQRCSLLIEHGCSFNAMEVA